MLSTAVVGLKCCFILRMGKTLIFSFTCKNLSQRNFCCWKVTAVSLLFSPVNFSICKHFSCVICVIGKELNIHFNAKFVNLSAEPAQVSYIMEGVLYLCFKYSFAVICNKWCWNWFQLSKMWMTQWVLMYCACWIHKHWCWTNFCFFHISWFFCQLCLSWVIQ